MVTRDFVTDILVIGSGIAGLYFALNVADNAKVTIITKKEKSESNTNYAQGGISAVLSPLDSFQNHVNDTMAVGDGLSDRSIVERVVSEAPRHISRLISLGVKFSKDLNGTLALGREGGHSKRRVVHVKDFTGQAIEKALLTAVARHPSIKLLENHFAINLVTNNQECLGCYVLDNKSSVVKNFYAHITVLTTGGIGRIHLHTSNPDIATGDGVAMAYRAGATIKNMEFIQFHPTCLYSPYRTSFLISEALRGEGAILYDIHKNRFMPNYHSMQELAPRDVVARAIDHELKKSGDNYVFLDISHKDRDFLKTRFPQIYKTCRSVGIDITKDPIPVVPAAHYSCGGVKTPLNGETDIKNLLAIGEIACTGFHGANRLASNSLLEALVCSYHAAKHCVTLLKSQESRPSIVNWESGEAVDIDEAVVITQNRDEIRHLMWNYVGIVRSDKRLVRAKTRIALLQDEINHYYWNFILTPELIELRNMALVAKLVIDSAQKRKESRGTHYSINYPQKQPIAKNTLLKKKSP